MKKLLSISIIFLLSASLLAQQKTSGEETFKDAEFFFSSGEYEEALYLFLQLTRDYPDNNNFHFRAGMSFLELPGKERESIPYFEKAVQNTTLKYKDKDFQIRQAPHHAWFYLGNAYRINNQLDKALESYEKFMDIRNFESTYNLRIVENEIAACQRAKIIQDSPVQLEKQNLGQEINSSSHNFQPVVNKDETVMVFMQRQRFYDAIMYSIKENGQWTKPINITPQIGSDGEMVPTGISPDGKELLLVRKISEDNGDIYYSRLEGTFWSKATDLGKTINTIKNEDHASFSCDGSYIIFSSDRRGGYGKLDLYITKRLNDNTLDQPQNMGNTINTEEDETSAYLAMNDKLLYFSSSGHFNMGGFDIFFSEKTDNGWSEPVNIGFPLNTTGDNRFYQPVNKGNTGYANFFNQKENLKEEDIYRIEITPQSKIQLPEAKKLDKSFSLEVVDKETNKIFKIHYNRATDEFTIENGEDINLEIKYSEQDK